MSIVGLYGVAGSVLNTSLNDRQAAELAAMSRAIVVDSSRDKLAARNTMVASTSNFLAVHAFGEWFRDTAEVAGE